MCFDYRAANRQPQAQPLLLARYEGLKDALPLTLRYPAPAVGDCAFEFGAPILRVLMQT